MLRYIAKFQTRMAQRNDERGATAVEYGLMVALIAAVIVGVVAALGTQLSTLFTNISSKI
jgi:pilus assembly protein Flp/PilA